MINNKCTILVNSCDAYEDIWNPFFKLLKKYWPDCKHQIILNTETKKFEYEGLDIKTINLPKKYQNRNVAWGKRLKNVLKQIDSKYILFMLDDFFIMDYVDDKKVKEVIEWMEQNNNIAVFSFFKVEDNKHEDVKSDKYTGFYLRHQQGAYRFNCQIAVWNRKELINSLRNFESAWDWELNGNIRSFRNKKEFYTLMDPKNYIFKYDYRKYGVIRGKWILPGTSELFKKENIDIDFNIRDSKKKNVEISLLRRKFNSLKYYINKARSRF